MNRSEEIKNIMGALGKFHALVDSLDRNKAGYGYNYATLENVLTTIREPLNTCGLVFSQFPVEDFGLTTLIVHTESGEYFETTSNIVPVVDNPQNRGSVITYLRRYHLVSILGLVVEDDDAATASGKKPDDGKSYTLPNVEQDESKPWLNEKDPLFETAIEKLKNGETDIEKIKLKFKLSKVVRAKLEEAMSA